MSLRNKVIIPLLLLSLHLCAQPSSSNQKIRTQQVQGTLGVSESSQLAERLNDLNDKLEYQQRINEQTLNSVSIQLESASFSLNVFGVVFSIAGIALGIYVTYVERKIVKLGETNKELLLKNQKIRDDVEAVNKLIQDDIHGLYLKIKREETVHILDRLIKVPKDISNVLSSLLSRELQNDDFSKLKLAYTLLRDSDYDYKREYDIVFFQHFLGQSLTDKTLKMDTSKFIPNGIASSFENDIIKSTVDFAKVLAEKGSYEMQPEINSFFSGLTNSHFKDFDEVYKALFDNLKSRKNRFDVFRMVESRYSNNHAKIAFGKLLEKEYLHDNPTEIELLAFNELKETIESQNKNDEELKKITASNKGQLLAESPTKDITSENGS